jgi:hypothetical protein
VRLLAGGAAIDVLEVAKGRFAPRGLNDFGSAFENRKLLEVKRKVLIELLVGDVLVPFPDRIGLLVVDGARRRVRDRERLLVAVELIDAGRVEDAVGQVELASERRVAPEARGAPRRRRLGLLAGAFFRAFRLRSIVFRGGCWRVRCRRSIGRLRGRLLR